MYAQQLTNNHTTCPLKLMVRGLLHMRYCKTSCAEKNNNVKVDQGVAQKYLDEIDNGETITDDMVDGDTCTVT
jgi:hypothetical protein